MANETIVAGAVGTGITQSEFFLPGVAAAVVIGAGVSAYMFRKLMPNMSFIYPNARLQARAQSMVDASKLNDLLACQSLADLVSSLKQTDYSEELDRVKDTDQLVQVHSALEKTFVKAMEELHNMSPQKIQPLLKAYVMFTETKVLKTIYRAMHSRVPVDETLVYPVGYITGPMLKSMIEAETLADINVTLDKTPYHGIFGKEYKSLEEFENALDSVALNNFVRTAKKTKVPQEFHIVKMVDTKTDIMNILTLIKLKLRGVEAAHQKKFLIKTDTRFTNRVDDLVKADSIKDLIERMKGLKFYDSLATAYESYEKDKSFAHFEQELMRFFKGYISANEMSNPLGPYPLFSYLMKKEIEQRNLFVISTAIDLKMDETIVKGLIV